MNPNPIADRSNALEVSDGALRVLALGVGVDGPLESDDGSRYRGVDSLVRDQGVPLQGVADDAGELHVARSGRGCEDHLQIIGDVVNSRHSMGCFRGCVSHRPAFDSSTEGDDTTRDLDADLGLANPTVPGQLSQYVLSEIRIGFGHAGLRCKARTR